MDKTYMRSRMVFISDNNVLKEPIWNETGYVVFDKEYSYSQLNYAFNKFVETFDEFRLKKTLNNGEISLEVEDFQFSDYLLLELEDKSKLQKVAKDIANSFIDSNGSLFRCIIFHMPGKSGYIVCAHHMIFDGFSAKIMISFVEKILQEGTVFGLKHLSFDERIADEKRYLSSKRYNIDRKFWLEQFSYKPQCEVFKDKKFILDFSSKEIVFSISEHLFQSISIFCINNNVSMQSFFNTVYAVYIYKKFGFDYFSIGVPVLNRTTEAELNTVGLYMHILPLLLKISDDSFLNNAINVEDAQMTLFRHQKFTKHDINELLKESGESDKTLFDIVANFQVFEVSENYEFELVYSNALSVPLEIHVQSFGGKKNILKIRYRTSMFEEKEIQSMINSIVTIAEGALEDPDKKITDLELISPSEKQTLLFDFNSTSHTFAVPNNSTLYSLFEKTAKENAKKICIKTTEKSVTFGELQSISENLDAEIQNITEGKKSVVAVIAERSAEMYGAIYGIIRGGNAYVPIDPDYPQERIEYILRNSDAAAVVAQDRFTDKAGNLPCIDMTNFLKDPEKKPITVPICAAEPDDTAYVIYTSGSTGTPLTAFSGCTISTLS